MVPVLYFCLAPYPGYFWSMRSLQSAQVMSAFAFSLLASTAALFFPLSFSLGVPSIQIFFRYFNCLLVQHLQMGLEGSSAGQWWLDMIGKTLDEGSTFSRVGSRQLAGLLISVW